MNGSRGPVPPPPDQMATMLSTIASQARRTNLVRVAEIRATLELATSEELNGDGWAVAERAAHQLAGSAGTFGYAEASHLARSLERKLHRLTEAGPARAKPEHLSESFALLERLIEQLAGEPELS